MVRERRQTDGDELSWVPGPLRAEKLGWKGLLVLCVGAVLLSLVMTGAVVGLWALECDVRDWLGRRPC